MSALAAILLASASCVGPVCNFDTLSPYFARLAAAREARGKPPVHILQIGDSHTAGDVLTGGWRELLQAQFGNGGRGMLAPGRPYDGYFTRGVTASMSPGWQVSATFGKDYAAQHLPIGLSSFSLTSTVPGATMALSADAPAMAFDRFVLCALAGMRAKRVTVRTGEGAQAVDLTSDIVEPRCTTLRFAAPQSSVEVSADAGPVTLTSWATFRDDGGVVLSNVGIVGSQLQHFARTDDAVLAEELRAYAPDLIVLAFGTNEGFAPSIDTAAYEATLRTQIVRLRRLSPDVPILLLGPPDALSRREELRGGQGNCPVIAGVAPVFAPPGLAQVRAVQRKVAADLHIAWWDWQARMGGLCAAERWVNQAPPLMRGDYVHFKTPGGAALARALQDDLDHAAQQEGKR
jgi:lysophospholipase L1-like esterase